MQRVVIAHSLEHIKTAVNVAQRLNTSLLLQSAPSAVNYAGSLYLKALADAASPHPFILDCGDQSGTCLGALRDGHKHLRIQATSEILEKLHSIAGQYHAIIHTQAYVALDLLVVQAPDAIEKWLKS